MASEREKIATRVAVVWYFFVVQQNRVVHNFSFKLAQFFFRMSVIFFSNNAQLFFRVSVIFLSSECDFFFQTCTIFLSSECNF